MRKQYDFSEGARGKYAERLSQATNLVRLDPDVAMLFPTSEAVNRPLRDLSRHSAHNRHRDTDP